jgi:hypothetical protein
VTGVVGEGTVTLGVDKDGGYIGTGRWGWGAKANGEGVTISTPTVTDPDTKDYLNKQS